MKSKGWRPLQRAHAVDAVERQVGIPPHLRHLGLGSTAGGMTKGG
jgi:hypothetical protein